MALRILTRMAVTRFCGSKAANLCPVPYIEPPIMHALNII
jgi:hypothetical protein